MASALITIGKNDHPSFWVGQTDQGEKFVMGSMGDVTLNFVGFDREHQAKVRELGQALLAIADAMGEFAAPPADVEPVPAETVSPAEEELIF